MVKVRSLQTINLVSGITVQSPYRMFHLKDTDVLVTVVCYNGVVCPEAYCGGPGEITDRTGHCHLGQSGYEFSSGTISQTCSKLLINKAT